MTQLLIVHHLIVHHSPTPVVQSVTNAKIRDDDHIHEYADGGLTTAENGQGLCKRSHTIKSLPAWKVTTDDNASTWQTPTGHTYRSEPPTLLGHLRQ